ncbi:hypothetical protein D8B26_004533 [Coccidioides posadasii str. Silveira]|uniref:Uncharacterized protein n=2 Tax=Coccidioides posadasii TaxID=199306 RepID=E9DEQ7_COCPS|nr:hypothetical protein CPSG_08307 [Coccidioides posadasii str. Silveira]QVM09873.1 hypothetical protein D8B26_004533 [Coccidioides posadasii str. Silveira]
MTRGTPGIRLSLYRGPTTIQRDYNYMESANKRLLNVWIAHENRANPSLQAKRVRLKSVLPRRQPCTARRHRANLDCKLHTKWISTVDPALLKFRRMPALNK